MAKGKKLGNKIEGQKVDTPPTYITIVELTPKKAQTLKRAAGKLLKLASESLDVNDIQDALILLSFQEASFLVKLEDAKACIDKAAEEIRRLKENAAQHNK